jgi:3-phosphoshikimate 1-carboxyvinyltransferase
MIAAFKPCRLAGAVDAPPSKSMAHRYLIGAALSGEVCTLSGIDFGEDILATLDCLRALGAEVTVCGDEVTVDPGGFMEAEAPVLDCRESGSTLRFLLPLALCLGRPVTLRGSRSCSLIPAFCAGRFQSVWPAAL